MFKFRIIGFTLLMALLAGIFFWRPWGEYLFLAAAPLITALAVYECAKMLNASGRKNFSAPAAIFSYLTIMAALLGDVDCAIKVSLSAAALTGGVVMLCKRQDLTEKFLNSCGLVLMLLPAMLGLLLSFYLETAGAPAGAWLLFLCLATKATDTGGYIVGTLTAKLPGGNHKIAPSLSPKKSWEGLFGGMLLSLAAGWAFYRFANYAPLWWYLATSLLLSLGSFFGDLAESAIKRMCDIKDSGKWVPGMGGAFDVLDSFIFNGILFYLPVMLLASL